MVTVQIVEYGAEEFGQVREVRNEVFVKELGVDPVREFDEMDTIAVHFLARLDGAPVGTARLYGDGTTSRIGRVGVLRAFRNQGVGEAMMNRAMDEAFDQGFTEIILHSQTAVAGFYEALGFVSEGDEFMEENIPHVYMRRVFDGGR